MDLNRILQFIEEHKEERISVPEMAALENMSVSAFKIHFRKIMKMPPAEYVLRKKIDCIKDALVSTQATVTELAYQYGFSSGQYLTTAFKRFCYMTPSEYRQKQREKK